MNLNAFLNHPDVDLPFRWAEANDYLAFLRQRLCAFSDAVNLLDISSVADRVRSRLPAIMECGHELVESVHSYMRGCLQEAYCHFDTAIQQLADEVSGSMFNLAVKDIGVLYRVRRTPSPRLHRKDIFHIPFELRHLVASQRYSIPGLPCLYLSGSLYTCWEEMGRPPFHELQAAAFWVKEGKSVKVLGFAERPSRSSLHLKPDGNSTESQIEQALANSIVIWPLLALSSIVVKHRDAPFRPEYIIPQMILQWVMRHGDCDGVCYFSTNVRGTARRHPLPLCNLVFPAKRIEPSGRCVHLCDVFKMTEPYGWELLRAISVGDGHHGGTMPMFDIDFIDGITESYHYSEFGRIQTRLNTLVIQIMQANRAGNTDLGDIGSHD